MGKGGGQDRLWGVAICYSATGFEVSDGAHTSRDRTSMGGSTDRGGFLKSVDKDSKTGPGARYDTEKEVATVVFKDKTMVWVTIPREILSFSKSSCK